jgi:hypothetical protein
MKSAMIASKPRRNRLKAASPDAARVAQPRQLDFESDLTKNAGGNDHSP